MVPTPRGGVYFKGDLALAPSQRRVAIMFVMSLTSAPRLIAPAARSQVEVRRVAAVTARLPGGTPAAPAASAKNQRHTVSCSLSIASSRTGTLVGLGGRRGVGDRRARRAAPTTARAVPEDVIVLAPPSPIADVAAGLEGGIQAIYLGSLLVILGFAGFIIIRQVFIRRELAGGFWASRRRCRWGTDTNPCTLPRAHPIGPSFTRALNRPCSRLSPRAAPAY
jgi:hypothetical protein